MTAKSIRFVDVCKSFGKAIAVDHISFEVAEGSLVTLLGPSGCGKTTTLRLIAGLDLASSGQIFIGEDEVTQLSASERDVSMVFQSYALFPHMSVADNVAYGLRVQKMGKDLITAKVEQTLATIGLSGFENRLPSELSGGQQQRVAVARALVLEPSVLLFDEPLSNLDAKLRRQMREEIRDLQQRLQLTVVYVTHDQAEAMAVSDHIIVMNKAVIAQQGPPQTLYRQPASVFVAGFIGESNLLTGELTSTAGGRTLTLGGWSTPLDQTDVADGQVTVSIRPEAICLRAATDTDSGLTATVHHNAYLGSQIEYHLQSPLGRLFVVATGSDTLYPLGARLALDIQPHGIVVLPPPKSSHEPS